MAGIFKNIVPEISYVEGVSDEILTKMVSREPINPLSSQNWDGG
jgi:hypothetical protein